MPNFRCQYCGGINLVPPDAIHFTCKHCGEVQNTPAFSEQVNTSLDEMMLAQEKAAPQSRPHSYTMPTQTHSESIHNPMITARKDSIYFTALSKIGGEEIGRYYDAIAMLESLGEWRDCKELIQQCHEKIASLQEEKEKKEKRRIQSKKALKKRRICVLVGFPTVVLLIAAVLLTIFEFVPNANYKQALAAAARGDTITAYEMFDALGGYKDSQEKAASLFKKYKEEKIQVAAVGDTLYFGTYEQDGDTANGKENIGWRVLDKTEDALLLLSVNGLDSVPYHSENTPVTWEICDYRKWLNKTFFNTAFTATEQQRICTTTVKSDKNPDYNTTSGMDTYDKVFVLSLSEVKKYMPRADERLCYGTAYAEKKSLDHLTGNQKCSWLLRTPGIDEAMICYVQSEGTIRHVGGNVNAPGSVVRPAIWLKIKF